MIIMVVMNYYLCIHTFTLACKILQVPETVTVQSGEEAVFSCTAECEYHNAISWNIVSPTTGRTIIISPLTSDSIAEAEGEGLTIDLRLIKTCDKTNANQTYELGIVASPELHRTPIQCSSYCSGGCCGQLTIYYSSFAVLLVNGESDLRRINYLSISNNKIKHNYC